MNISTQAEIDYMEAAQQRVAADTRLLVKTATITVTAGVSVLADEVIRLEALYDGSTPLGVIPVTDYMRITTGQPSADQASVFCVVGRTVYVYPAASTTLTAYYSYRPPALESSASFALSGPAERLIERLAAAYVLMDDGQPELAQAELTSYATDAARLRRRSRRTDGRGGVLRVPGRRVAPR